MSTISSSLSDFFSEATTLIANAQQHPEIAAALDVFGYDTAVLQEGQALLDAALTLYDAQIKEYGEQHAATQAFLEAAKGADNFYAAHRRLAKLALKNDAQRQTDLRLNQRKPEAFNPWYDQARHFYIALLADTDAQTQLARYKITPKASRPPRLWSKGSWTSRIPRNRRKAKPRKLLGSATPPSKLWPNGWPISASSPGSPCKAPPN